jgi:hypothetical protein
VRKVEAEEIREQLLELLDERHEAGPTDYIVHRTTVEPVSSESGSGEAQDWALVVVVKPSLLASPVTRSFAALQTAPDGPPVTPEAVAWHVYGLLEAGELTQ